MTVRSPDRRPWCRKRHTPVIGRHVKAAVCVVGAAVILALPNLGARAQSQADGICATTSDPTVCQQLIQNAIQQGAAGAQLPGQGGVTGIEGLLQGLNQNQNPAMAPAPQPSVIVSPAQPSLTHQRERSRLEDIYSQRAGEELNQFGYDLVGNGGTVSALQIGAIQDDYILGQGDAVVVTLRGQENATYDVFVDRDGNVTLPRLRPISASGRRFGDFRRDLDQAVRSGYIQTQAFVTIGQVRQISVSVVGEVMTPGVTALSGLSTVLDALNLAGGVKKSGSLRNIMVVRDGLSMRIDLYKFLAPQGKTPDMTLRQGDRIVVEPLGATVAVSGSVRRPGIYELPAGVRDASAHAVLALANGYTIRGLYRQTIVRTRANGTQEYVDAPAHSEAMVRDGEILAVSDAANYSSGNVTLEGNVRLPGVYALNNVRTLRDLLPSTQAFLPMTYMPFAFVVRQDPKTLLNVLIPFSVQALVGGKYNLDLQSQDVVHILTFNAMRELLNLRTAANAENGENINAGTPNGPDDTQQAPGGSSQPLIGAASLPGSAGAVQAGTAALSGCSPAIPSAGLQNAAPSGGSTAVASTSSVQTLLAQLAAAQSGQGSSCGTAATASGATVAAALAPSVGRDAVGAAGQAPDPSGVEGLSADEAATIGFVAADYRVTVEGGVRQPGDFLAAPGTTLDEVVAAANGLVLDADLNAVEITSVAIDNVGGHSDSTRKLYSLTPDRLSSVSLQRLDVVEIPRVPADQEKGSVSVSGEVQFPGTYHILKGEHLSSLLQRAGGLTKEAYPLGAVFQRPSVALVQQAAYQRDADDMQKQLVAAVAQGGSALASASAQSPGLSAEAAGFVAGVIQQLRTKAADGRISIIVDPAVLAANPGTDFELQPGDQLFIPSHPTEIVVAGEVLNPGNYRFSPKLNVSDYIGMSGGYDRYADDDHVFVINPDGTSRGVSEDLFDFSSKSLAPGSVVVVPRDLRPLDLGVLTVMVGKVLSDLAISAASLAVISHSNN